MGKKRKKPAAAELKLMEAKRQADVTEGWAVGLSNIRRRTWSEMLRKHGR